jgi:hypothetical protein
LALLLVNPQGFLVFFQAKIQPSLTAVPVMLQRINMARFSFASLLMLVDDQNQQTAQRLQNGDLQESFAQSIQPGQVNKISNEIIANH